MANIRKTIASDASASATSGANKKKIAASVVLALILAIAGVFAYLTATDQANNRFSITRGLAITVEEPNWVPPTGMLPGQTVTKDPLIINDTGVDAYLFMQVVVPRENVIVANADGTKNPAASQDLFTYVIDDENWELVEIENETPSQTEYASTYLYVYKGELDGNNKTSSLFSEITLKNIVDDQLHGGQLIQDVYVNGFGIQKSGFDNAIQAWEVFSDSNDIDSPVKVVVTDTALEDSSEYNLYNLAKADAPIKANRIAVGNDDDIATEGYESATVDFGLVMMEQLAEEETQELAVVLKGSNVSAPIKTMSVTEENISSGEVIVGIAPSAAQLAVQYAEAYEAAEDNQKGTLGDEVIWWMNSSEEIHIAPVNGESGTMVKTWGTGISSPFSSVSTLAKSAIVEPGVEACSDINYMFSNCSSLTSLNASNLNTSNVTGMVGLFYRCRNLVSLNISTFDTFNVTSMYNMFCDCSSLKSVNVSSFDTSKVEYMDFMFDGCSSLMSIIGLSNWDTSKTHNLRYTFNNCSSLTTLDMSNFDTSNMTDMYYMCHNCSSLTSLNLSNFDTSKVTDMRGMFRDCSSLKSLNISNWDIKATTSEMFYNCSSLTSLDLSSWNVSRLSNPTCMFFNCSALLSLDVSSFNISQTTNMSSMFYNCSSLTSLDLSNFDTTNVTNMSSIFNGCSSLTSLNLSNWNTANVTNMQSMFRDCSSFTTFDASSINTSNVTDMTYMFKGCSSITSITNLSSWNTSNVTIMQSMFDSCSSLESISGLSNWNTSKVSNMGYMFQNCEALISPDVSTINTSNVSYMVGMFKGCSSLTSLDLSNWVTTKLTNTSSMFQDCSSLVSLNLSNWDISKLKNMKSMFEGTPESARPSWYTG